MTTPSPRSPRADEVEVTPLYEPGGDIVELFARGHVDRAAFLAAANAEWTRLTSGDPWDLDDVKHTWRRAVPDRSGDLVCLYHPATAGARGAFRATIIEVCP